MFIKFLEDNKAENLYDLGLDKDFLDKTVKAWSIKENKRINWTYSILNEKFGFQKTSLKKLIG